MRERDARQSEGDGFSRGGFFGRSGFLLDGGRLGGVGDGVLVFQGVKRETADELPDAEEQERDQRLDGGLHFGRSDAVAEHIRRGVKERVSETVKQNARDGQRHNADREERVTERPSGQTGDENAFQTDTTDGERQRGHKEEFRNLVQRAEDRGFVRRDVQNVVDVGTEHREVEVRTEDRDHKGADHERGEVLAFEERESLQTERVVVLRAGRRGVRKGQRVSGENERNETAEVEARRRFHDEVNEDPAERPENEDERSFVFIRNVFENDGVDQRNRRHISETGDEHQRDEGGHVDRFGVRNDAASEKRRAAEEVHKRQNLLRRELAVGDRADHRSEESAEREERIKSAGVEPFRRGESAESDVPRTPNRKLHQIGDLQTPVHTHRNLLKVFRKYFRKFRVDRRPFRPPLALLVARAANRRPNPGFLGNPGVPSNAVANASRTALAPFEPSRKRQTPPSNASKN